VAVAVATSVMEDVRHVRGWAAYLVDHMDGVQAGRVRPEVTLAGGATLDRREVLWGRHVRQVLRGLDADVARLQAVAQACQAAQHRSGVQGDAYAVIVYRTAEQLAAAAAGIVADAGMPVDAGPDTREAVMAEADLWLAHLEPGWAGILHRARRRRRRLIRADIRRRLSGGKA
jgi:hypothetical protein